MGERNDEREKVSTLRDESKINERVISILTFAGVILFGIALIAIIWGVIGWNR